MSEYGFEYKDITGHTDLKVSDEDYNKARDELIEFAKEHDFTFNPDENCWSLIAKVVHFKCCPCHPGMKCPCKAAVKVTVKAGKCPCGLFVPMKTWRR